MNCSMGYRRLTNGCGPQALSARCCCAGRADQAEREAQSGRVDPRPHRPGRLAAFQRAGQVAEFEADLIRMRTQGDG